MTQAIAGIGSLVGGLSGLFGGSNPIPQYNPTISPSQTQGVISNANTAIQGLSPYLSYAGATPGQLGAITPQFGQIASNIAGTPYATSDLSGQVSAAGMAPGLAGLQYGTGLNLTGTGLSQIPYINQTMQTAFDPQNALYNRLLAQTQNQQNVQNTQAGVGTTPYGASLADLNLQNFNIDWQNNLLNRMATGAQTASTLGSNITGLTGAGLQASGMAPGTLSTLSALPYNTYVGQQGNVTSALQNQINALLGQQGSATNALSAYNTPFNDYMAMLGGLNQTNQVYNQGYAQQLAAQNQQFQQQQAYGNEIGAGISGIATGFGLPTKMTGLNLGFGNQMG
jgi:hypothetical protein